MPRSIRELTSALASGDSEALAVLYRERFDWMYAEARRCTGRDESFCLDVVQDAMLKVIRAMKPLDDEPQLIAWLRTVVQRCAYDRLRADKRRLRHELNASAALPAESATPVDDGRLAWLANQVRELSEDKGQLLGLRFGLGWTLQQIGSRLGLKPGAVDGRLNRTLAALRKNALEEFHE